MTFVPTNLITTLYPFHYVYHDSTDTLRFSTEFFVPTVTDTFLCYNHLRSNTIILDNFLFPASE